MRMIRAVPVSDMRVVLGENNIAVLVILVIILRITYLLLTSESEADPAEVCYVWPGVPESLR